MESQRQLMKKNDLIDFVLEKGASCLVRSLGNLGDYSKLQKVSVHTPLSEYMKIVADGKIPYVEDYQKDFYPIYTSDEIISKLSSIALKYLETGEDRYVKEYTNLMYFGLDDQGRYFGTYFFLPGFELFFEQREVFSFSDKLLEEVEVRREGPSYFLKHNI